MARKRLGLPRKLEEKLLLKNRALHERYKESLRQEQRTGEQAEAAARQLEYLRTEGGKEIAGPRSEKPVIDEPRLLAGTWWSSWRLDQSDK